jgi:hypothetical protein
MSAATKQQDLAVRRQIAENDWLRKHRNHLGMIVSVRLSGDEPKVVRRMKCEECGTEFKFEAD